MAGLPLPPELIKPITPQIVNEGGAYGPFDLKEFIESPTPESGKVRFFAELLDGSSLPKGLICTTEGLLSGIPPKGTQGSYEIVIIAENESGLPITAQFNLTIKPSLAAETQEKGAEWWNDLKAKVWEAMGKDLTDVPNLQEMYKEAITPAAIYYLLQRFATLTIWDAYNLEAPGDKIILNLEDASPHYVVYDRGSCLVAAPKDLFSHARTLADALQTSKAAAREVYKRGWTIQLAGFEKMTRIAWIELQHLGDKHRKYLDILHYTPSSEDIKLYTIQSEVSRLTGG